MNRVAKRIRELGEDGFTLVEVLTALAIIGVVLTATTAYFVRSMVVIDGQGARQTALEVATDGMESLRAVSGTQALTWLQARPASEAVTVNSLTYQRAWTFPTVSTDGLLSATVTVTWIDRTCPDAGCSYSATTMISTATAEPVFAS
jgi:prepilin-type N-terminal cleavage/methylation domain-containing protein